MSFKLVVVGGGIIGLGSAYCLIKQFPEAKITLISDSFSPNTTGDGSAGLWTPYLTSDTPPELIEKWSLGTLHWFLQLWNTEDGGKLGLSLVPLITVGSDGLTAPCGALGLHELSPAELRRLNMPNKEKGFSYTTFTCEPRKLLPYFLQEFIKCGGIVTERRVEDLEGLTKDFDIVVHCTGLRASELTSDDSLHPIRGQVHRVKAPHIFHIFMEDSGAYVIPNQEAVILGGTHQENDWNLNVSQEDKDAILSGCAEMIPSLKGVTILEDWVGLRPARNAVRLEREKVIGRNGKPSFIIHNYGHGGSGVTLFWGCALNVAQLVRESLREI